MRRYFKLFSPSLCFKLLLSVYVSALAVGVVQADPVANLYQSQTLVQSQSDRERNNATIDGLAEVFVRASGQKHILENPAVIQTLTSSASRYVAGYRYDPTDETLMVEDREVPAQRLVLDFAGEAIQRFLRNNQLPLWPANRPTSVLWIVVDSAQGRTLVDAGNFPEAIVAARDSARRRGLPNLTFPLLDLEDRAALSTSQLWRGDVDAIKKASERYQSDSIVVGRLNQTSQEQWRASWTLYYEGRSFVFDSIGTEINDVVAEGMDNIAEQFAQRYSVILDGGAGNLVAIQVDDVGDFAGYATMMKYLENLAVIRRTDLVGVSGNSVRMNLTVEGDVSSLINALNLEQHLTPSESLSQNVYPAGSQENPLRYVLR